MDQRREANADGCRTGEDREVCDMRHPSRTPALLALVATPGVTANAGASDTALTAAALVLAARGHRPGSLRLRARERGYAVDRIVLTTRADFVPSTMGPSETRSP